MTKAILKDKLAGGGSAFGAIQNIFDPLITEAIAKAGVDFILFDLEHAGYATHQLDACVLAAFGYNVPALVRPREIEQSLIEQALEAGGQGVVLPTVETVEQCELIVRAAKYGPHGARGFDPTFPISRWLNNYNIDTYLADANRDVFVVILVETPLGFNNLPEMLQVDGIDAVMFGAADLTVRMGKPLPGTTACIPNDKEIPSIIATATKQAVSAGKTVFGVASPEQVRDSYDAGVRMFIPPTMDTWVLTDYYKVTTERSRATLHRNPNRA